MQTIYLKKFGAILVSRPAGREAFHAIRPTLHPKEKIHIDFDGVLTVTPSWFDEFLTNLVGFAESDVDLLPTDNSSFNISLPVLISAHNDEVGEVLKRAQERDGKKGGGGK